MCASKGDLILGKSIRQGHQCPSLSSNSPASARRSETLIRPIRNTGFITTGACAYQAAESTLHLTKMYNLEEQLRKSVLLLETDKSEHNLSASIADYEIYQHAVYSVVDVFPLIKFFINVRTDTNAGGDGRLLPINLESIKSAMVLCKFLRKCHERLTVV